MAYDIHWTLRCDDRRVGDRLGKDVTGIHRAYSLAELEGWVLGLRPGGPMIVTGVVAVA